MLVYSLMENSVEKEGKLYEIAYHLASSIEEGKVEKEAGALEALITKAGGEVVSKEAPRFVELSYPISRRHAGKTELFTHAYFGSFAFRADKAEVTAFKKSADEMDTVIRTMVIAIDAGLLEERKNRGMVKGERVTHVVDETKEEAAVIPPVVTGPLDEVALDKSIEQMVTE